MRELAGAGSAGTFAVAASAATVSTVGEMLPARSADAVPPTCAAAQGGAMGSTCIEADAPTGSIAAGTAGELAASTGGAADCTTGGGEIGEGVPGRERGDPRATEGGRSPGGWVEAAEV